MSRPRVLAIVLAGGAGSRLGLLTERRAKPVVPFGGHYRLIDFPLSNCLHSGISDVWVVMQFHPGSLSHHLSGGRPWDLDRTTGGLLPVPPHRGDERGGWHEGTADALWRQADRIREHDPDVVVVVSADAVYRMDYDALVSGHLASGALATMVTTQVAAADAGRYGVVVGDGDTVRRYDYKPDRPASDVVSNEVFVFAPSMLLEELEAVHDEAGPDGLEDLGTRLLPRLVTQGAVRQHRFADYWRDVGTIDAYWAAHMELLADPSPFVLDDPRWPVRTAGGTRPPARIDARAQVSDSLVSGGARVVGEVEHCVVAPGAVVEAGSYVRDSVLLPGAVVRVNARVERAILDDHVEVGADAVVGGPDAISVVGLTGHVTAGSRLEAGTVFPDLTST